MEKGKCRKSMVIGAFVILFSFSFIQVIEGIYQSVSLEEEELMNESSDLEVNENFPLLAYDGSDTEYWALLVAVGIYAYTPEMNIGAMLMEVDDLYNTLLVSEHWEEDHIKIIKGENATVLNIFEGFRWLDDMEDENDICLVFFTTHGFPILFDLPPRDEEDGMDEALAMYRGFLPFKNPWSWEPLANPLGIITDDEINYFLNRLESQGICMIVDSCHSGGFNDNWSYARKAQYVDFAKELGKDLEGRNRVIMSSVSEEETSGVGFSYFLTEGMKGYSDENKDGICSAEEAFWYAESETSWMQGLNPQIFDDYPGELPLTEVELPPLEPICRGETIVKTNTTYIYQLYSEDPEGDRIRYFIDWGDGNKEMSDLVVSGEVINLTHSWNKECTYVLRVTAEDEKGVVSNTVKAMVTATGKCCVDQRQIEVDDCCFVNETFWLAQSFIPSLNTLAKIELGLISSEWVEGKVTIAVREKLTGDDLVTCSAIPTIRTEWELIWWFTPDWVMFDLSDIELIPGKEYYIVCKTSWEGWRNWWSCQSENPYMNGGFYYSMDAGDNWREWRNFDACFVTYG